MRDCARAATLCCPGMIADSIAEMIAVKTLKPGDRLVEAALTEIFSVSRVPIREALKILGAQGILTGEGQRGFRVADFGAAMVQQVPEVRLSLEVFLLRNALNVWKTDRRSFRGLQAAIHDLEAATRRGDRKAALRAGLQFHRAISRASGNSFASAMWEGIARHVLIIFSREEYRTADLNMVAAQHREFLKELDGLTGSGADEATLRKVLMMHHLKDEG